MTRIKLITIIAISVIGISTGTYFAIASNDISSQTILDTDKTTINQNIQYPTGHPQITSKIITIPVGAETGEHIHEYPMFAYVLEGEITIDYKDKGIRTFEKGDSFVEAVNHTHNGKNYGSEPTKILTVLIGKNQDKN